MQNLLFTFLLAVTGPLLSQSYTINGYVYDGETGEALIGGSVLVTSLKKGATTNTYGFYSITLPPGDSVGIVFSYHGYTAQVKKVYLTRSVEINVPLMPVAYSLDEVVIEAKDVLTDQNVQKAQMGVVDIPITKILELPVLLGETDVLKVVQLLPGVQAGNEGTTGFFVRGGNADQNLVQLDEATVYNPNHLFGLFSTFNSRALNSVSLIKGGFPAQYGGRLSSILDVSMKEGNNRKFGAEGGIGLISSQLTFEGPLQKEKASFIVSGRRTYMDWLIKPFLPKGNQSNYRFYDLNAKVNWKLGDKDRLFVSAFKGNDDAEYKAAEGINYRIFFGNSTATLRWNHLFGQKLFSNTSFIFNNYEQDITAIQDNAFSQTFSGIKDVNGKLEFQYYPNLNHAIRFGLHYMNHGFHTGGRTGAQTNGGPVGTLDVGKLPVSYNNEFAAYIQDEFSITERFSLNLGLRAPGFVSKNVSYYRVEPRANLKIGLSETSSIKAAYTLMNQFLHLIPSSTATVPTDIWIPSSKQTKPQVSAQYAVGYFRNFADNRYESSVEVYYKTMDNQVLFQEGNQLVENLNVDEFLTYGRGWSYGAEFFLKKNSGKLTGWISYTLSKTEQQFDELNFGEKFPFRYDRRHALSAVASYALSKRWTLSGVFVYSTGAVYTLPTGRIHAAYGGSLFEGNYFVYEGRNNTRLGAYHRLDLSATYRKPSRLFKKDFKSEWVLGFYNIYSRQNPYFVYFKVDPLTDQPQAKQVSLLPIMPAISYNFKF